MYMQSSEICLVTVLVLTLAHCCTLYTEEMMATLSFSGKMTSKHLYEISTYKLVLDKAVG